MENDDSEQRGLPSGGTVIETDGASEMPLELLHDFATDGGMLVVAEVAEMVRGGVA